MREMYHSFEVPENADMRFVVASASLAAANLLMDPGGAVSMTRDPETNDEIYSARVAYPLASVPSVLDQHHIVRARMPEDGSPPAYEFAYTWRGPSGILLSYSWQGGGDIMKGHLDAGGTTADIVLDMKLAADEVQNLQNAKPYNPETESIVTSMHTGRQRIVRNTLLVGLAKKIGWYY